MTMAKAKKTSDETKSAAEKKTGKKAAKKPAASAAPAGVPQIGTGGAAAAAASLIRNKVSTDAATPGKKPSAGFQQMKDSLTKSHSATVGGLLGEVQGKKSQGG